VSLIQRDPESNKGDHGTLAILGGSPGMVGAAVLSARCALFSGTGRVVIARLSLADGFVLDTVQPEVMVIDVSAHARAWALRMRRRRHSRASYPAICQSYSMQTP